MSHHKKLNIRILLNVNSYNIVAMVIKLEDMCYKYADYLIRLYNEQREKQKYKLSNKRLQKILFIASVKYSIDNPRKRLFSDDFEAWSYGPVMPEVYKDYSIFQDGYMFPLYPKTDLDDDKAKVLENIFEETREISTEKLIENAHRAGAPWFFCYTKEKLDTKKVSNYNIIPQDVIYEYYRIPDHYKELLEH